MDMYLATMLQSLAALLDVRGIIRMLEALLEPTAYSRPYFRKRVVWATAKTLLQHRAWIHFPLLVSHMPHILLGGTMQGIDLHSDLSEEPIPQKRRRPLAPSRPAGNAVGSAGSRGLQPWATRLTHS